MDVDIGNALASTASPGVSVATLERVDERVAAAHERIQDGRASDDDGYAALNLPDRTDPDAVRRAIAPIADADALVTIGIGGSALGAATIVDALPSDTRTVFLDNVDPAWISEHVADLPLERTAVNVVSKSGRTAETLANFLVVREALSAAGIDWTERTVVTTGESGPLRAIAERHDLPTLTVPDGVPGRFSALSPVGLVAPAVCGHDIEALLAGARAEAASLSDSLFECPAYAYGATAYTLDTRGAQINAMLPYAECLETFGEWFAQLWAESLGKDGLGQTPVRGLGATDQHSQLQLYRAGPRDKMVTFLTPRQREDRPIPGVRNEAFAQFDGTTLGGLLDAERKATEASLAAAGRPSVRLELERVDAYELGSLLYGMEVACILAAHLYGIDPFDQPAVEWTKRATRALLDRDRTDEEAVGSDDTTLRVERRDDAEPVDPDVPLESVY